MTWNPSPRTFARAVSRGLGRCVLSLRRCPDPARYRDALHDAFLHYGGYDQQSEGTRTQYLFDLAEAAGISDELREIALQALASKPQDHWDFDQLVALTYVFASDGDQPAQETLNKVFEQVSPFQSGHFDSISWAVIQFSGVAGFLTVARRLGEAMQVDSSVWTGYPAIVAERLWGEDVVARELAAASANDPNVAVFRVRLEEERQEPAQPPKPRGGSTFRALVETFEEDARRGVTFWGSSAWARRAPAAERQKAANALLTETDPTRQILWLNVFDREPFPSSIDRLIELSASADAKVRWAAIRALAMVKDGTVRAYAWTALRQSEPNWEAVRLLKANYQSGDECELLAILPKRVRDDDVADRITRAILFSFEARLPNTDAGLLYRWAYEHTPCSHCRHNVVDDLLKHGLLPAELADECRWDCDEDTRALVWNDE